MAKNKFKAQWKGWDGYIRRIKMLERKIATEGIAASTKAAMKPMLDKTQSLARAEKKTAKGFHKSIISKLKKWPRYARVQGVIGPSRNYKVEGSPYNQGKKNKGRYVPNRIAHLLEKGFTTRSGDKVPGRRTVSRAYNATKAKSLKIFKATIKENIGKHAAQIGRKKIKLK